MLRDDEYIYGQLFEYLIKPDCVGRYEYPETINGACELLMCTSRQFGGIILRGGSRSVRNERGCGGRTRVVPAQIRVRGDQGERILTLGCN